MGREVKTLNIAQGTSKSDALDRYGHVEMASIAIAALEGDGLMVETAGDDTDATAPADGDFVPLYNDNGEQVIIPVPVTPMVASLDKWVVTVNPVRWIRFRPVTGTTPENQTVARTLKVQVII